MLILNIRYVLGLSHYNGLGKEDSLKVLGKAGLNGTGQKQVTFPTLIFEFRIKISIGLTQSTWATSRAAGWRPATAGSECCVLLDIISQAPRLNPQECRHQYLSLFLLNIQIHLRPAYQQHRLLPRVNRNALAGVS